MKKSSSKINNIIFIDKKVILNNIFANSCSKNTQSFIYNKNSTKEELITKIGNVKNIDRIAFIFDEMYLNQNIFINNEPFFIDADLTESNVNNLSSNFKFIICLCIKYNVKNIDFLVCNSLNYEKWNKFYNQINFLTQNNFNIKGVYVGASDMKVGNSRYGGTWIMKTTNENIQNIYFTENIIDYPYTLSATTVTASPGQTIYIQQNGGNIQYQINSTSGSWTNLTFPVTFVNSNPSSQRITVSLFSDIELADATYYFIMGSNLITVDGTIYTVSHTGIANYPGFVQSTSYSGIFVNNINMSCGTSSLANNAGWIGQYASSNTNFNNCSSDGNIGDGTNTGGGIAGNSCGGCVVTNCWSSGVITGRASPSPTSSGGILGLGCVGCGVVNCYSTGAIGDFSGGIVGSLAFGIDITYCYSLGSLNSAFCGGILGSLTTGTVPTNIKYCYVLGGNILGDAAGANVSYCYIANGSWNDSDAIAAGITGSEWIDIAPSATNVPYLLSSFNTNFYNGAIKTTVLTNNQSQLTLTNVNINSNSLFTILSGGTSDLIIYNDYTNLSSFGQLQYIGTNTSATNKFNLQILNGTEYDPGLYHGYNIINFTFTSVPLPINQFINSGIRNVRIG